MMKDTVSSLDHMLALAVAPAPASKPVYTPSQARKLTRRGILWLGQTCNLRCQFCYFLDRIEDENHPEHPFMTLEKAQEICRTLSITTATTRSTSRAVSRPCGRRSTTSLYCTEIGLSPTIITNAQALANREVVSRHKHAGIRDFLVSVQGLGPTYDQLGREGAHVRQLKALRNLQEAGVPFRFNTVLSKPALPQLPDIARLAVRTGQRSSISSASTRSTIRRPASAATRTSHGMPSSESP